MSTYRGPFDDGDFVFRQAIQVVNQPVDFRVGRFNLALDRPALGLGLGRVPCFPVL
jgi:hypothetical protein